MNVRLNRHHIAYQLWLVSRGVCRRCFVTSQPAARKKSKDELKLWQRAEEALFGPIVGTGNPTKGAKEFLTSGHLDSRKYPRKSKAHWLKSNSILFGPILESYVQEEYITNPPKIPKTGLRIVGDQDSVLKGFSYDTGQETIEETSEDINNSSDTPILHNKPETAALKEDVKDSVVRDSSISASEERTYPERENPAPINRAEFIEQNEPSMPDIQPILTYPMLANNSDVLHYVSNGSDTITFPSIPQSYDQKARFDSYCPSVSTVLDKTRPPEAQFLLDRWKEKMIAELGEEGFQKYQKELLTRGSNLHKAIQGHLEGVPDTELTINEENVGHWESLRSVFPDVTDVKAIECQVKHPDLNYLGYFDCVAMYRDQLCVIDWKTSKKKKRSLQSTFDSPLQVAAYVGAFNQDPRYPMTVDHAALVIAYEDGSPAQVHLMTRDTCIYYWGQWLSRLHKYYTGAAEAGLAQE